MDRTCACGHVEDEHGHDPKYPNSTACNAAPGGEPCDCIAFDPGEG